MTPAFLAAPLVQEGWGACSTPAGPRRWSRSPRRGGLETLGAEPGLEQGCDSLAEAMTGSDTARGGHRGRRRGQESLVVSTAGPLRAKTPRNWGLGGQVLGLPNCPQRVSEPGSVPTRGHGCWRRWGREKKRPRPLPAPSLPSPSAGKGWHWCPVPSPCPGQSRLCQLSLFFSAARTINQSHSYGIPAL